MNYGRKSNTGFQLSEGPCCTNTYTAAFTVSAARTAATICYPAAICTAGTGTASAEADTAGTTDAAGTTAPTADAAGAADAAANAAGTTDAPTIPAADAAAISAAASAADAAVSGSVSAVTAALPAGAIRNRGRASIPGEAALSSC